MLFAVEHLHDARRRRRFNNRLGDERVFENDRLDRARGGREIHVFAGQVVVDRHEAGHHVVGCQTGTLERVEQAVAVGHQLLDLGTGHFTATGQFGKDFFAVIARLVDHVATLLFGQFNFCLGVGCGIFTTTHRLEFGFLAEARSIAGCFLHEAGGGLFGALADLGACLAGHRENPGGFFAEKRGDHFLVEHARRRHAPGLHGLEFTFEESLAFLEPGEFSRHHAQEVAHLGLVVAAARNGERCSADSRR